MFASVQWVIWAFFGWSLGVKRYTWSGPPESHTYLCSGTLDAWLQENDPNSHLFPKPKPGALLGIGHILSFHQSMDICPLRAWPCLCWPTLATMVSSQGSRKWSRRAYSMMRILGWSKDGEWLIELGMGYFRFHGEGPSGELRFNQVQPGNKSQPHRKLWERSSGR